MHRPARLAASLLLCLCAVLALAWPANLGPACAASHPGSGPPLTGGPEPLAIPTMLARPRLPRQKGGGAPHGALGWMFRLLGGNAHFSRALPVGPPPHMEGDLFAGAREE